MKKSIKPFKRQFTSLIFLSVLLFLMAYSYPGSEITSSPVFIDTINTSPKPSQYANPSRGAIEFGDGDGVFWFIHLTDTQNMWVAAERTLKFIDFLNTTEHVINPALYIHTGDIVDSDYHGFFGPKVGQLDFEWLNYSQALQITNMTSDIYYDSMGNHDIYGDPGFTWYLNYSMQKKLQYDFVRDYSFGRYHFVALHTPENGGAYYPFSLNGYLSKEELDWYETTLQKEPDADVTVAFGHHPAYEMFEGQARFHQLNRRYGVDLYLVGHGHMDTYQELESGTVSYMTPQLMNSEKSYRLFAIQGTTISESVQAYGQWPIGVICSPADHKNVYGDYNHELLKSTSKIRALAFDRTAISKVEWSVDGNGQWKPMTNAHGPLYEADWDQALNDGKIHRVEVRITNVDGDTKIEQIEFSSVKVEHFGWQYGYRIAVIGFIALIAVPTARIAKNRWMEPTKYQKSELERVDPILKKNMLARLFVLLFVPLTFAYIWPGQLTGVFSLYYISSRGLIFNDNNFIFGVVLIIFSFINPSGSLSKRKCVRGLFAYPFSMLIIVGEILIYYSYSAISLLCPGYIALLILDVLAIRRTIQMIKEKKAAKEMR